MCILSCQDPVHAAFFTANPERERELAHQFGTPWPMRGPPPPKHHISGRSQTWRGQKWRAGSQRYANPGGIDRDRYAMFYYYQRDPWFHPNHTSGFHEGLN